MIDTGAARPTRRWRAAAGAALLTLYRLGWIALFGAALVTAGYFAPRDEAEFQAAYIAASSFGFWIFQDASLEGQLGGPLGDEGKQAGFRNFDLLLTVDGRAVTDDNTAKARLFAGPAGSIAVIGLRHPAGEHVMLRVARDPGRLTRALAGSGLNYVVKRWTQFGFMTAAEVALMIAAALLFVRRPRDPVAQILSFSIVLGRPDLVGLLHIAPIVGQVVGEAAYILLLTALLLFPDGRLGTRWHWLTIILFIASSGCELIEFWSSSINKVAQLLDLATLATMVLAVLTQYRRTPAGTLRQQSKFVLFGIVAFCLAQAAATLLILAEGTPGVSVGAVTWMSLATVVASGLGLAALPAGLFVSLFRYRLYDAESTISRSVVYGTLTLALLAIFAGAEKMIEILGEQYFGEKLGAVAGALGAGFAAFMMVPLHHRVTHWAEHRFQGDLVHLRTALPVLAADMSATATPARLADAVLARVEKGVRAVHGAVVAGSEVLDARDVDADAVAAWLAVWHAPDDDACVLHADRADALFPMRIPLCADGVGLVGWLLLGPRPDGSFYGSDERDVLLAIAEPVARALAVTRYREARDVERRREIGGLATRLGLLETRIMGVAPLAA